MSERDADALHVIVWQLHEFLHEKLSNLLLQSSGSAALISYAGDATPLRMAWRGNHQCPLGMPSKTVRRQSVHKVDFFVQRLSVKVQGPEGFKVATLPIPPVPLLRGKSAWHLFNAAQRVSDMIPQAHGIQSGVRIWHFCLDRGATAVARMCFQHRKLSQGVSLTSAGAEQHNTASVSELLLCTGCSIHDTHNAFKWALHAYASDTSSVSLRVQTLVDRLVRCIPALHRCLPQFLAHKRRSLASMRRVLESFGSHRGLDLYF